MVMQRTAGRRSKPPVLEFARNVDATIAAALEGAGLVYRNGKWQPENTISAIFFMATALAALPVGTPVTVTTTGVVAATSGNVHGIVAKASTAAGQSIPILRQGSMTLTGTFPANSLLYISDKGVLSTTAADTSYFVGFTTTANNAFFLIGGGGGSGGGAGAVKVDGTTITNTGGVLSAISTNVPAANTLVRTQDNGKLSTDLLDAPGLFSGVQVRYLVPTGTTWKISPEKCVVTSGWPLSVAANAEYKLTSPFGNTPAIAECYINDSTSGVWHRVDVICGTTGTLYGIIANCPGDGYVYVATCQYLNALSLGTAAPSMATSLSTAEVVIALYCQKTEVTATRVMGARQKYLVAPGTAWNRSASEDTITLSDMPPTFSGGAPTTKKFVSPFGSKPVKLESWVLFAGQWRKEHMFNSGSNYFGHMAACPGDGYIYFNAGFYPQSVDSLAAMDNCPVGDTGTNGSTAQYQICLVATVHETIELPTVRAKDIAELGVLGSASADLSALVTIGTVSSPIYTTWYAPSNGFVTLAKTVSDSTVGAIRMDVSGTAVGLGRVNENANPQVVSAFVLKGQKYTMYRTGSGITFTFTPVVYDTTALVLSDKATDGGSTNPSDGLRVGEVRNYSRYDTEIASNASFVNISEATQIDTTAYPEFAALVGVTGQYPIAAASLAGAQTIPYLYLGTYNGGAAPKALTENISFGPDTTAMANNSILFVTDGDETVNVALVTVDDAENPALTAPALLLSVESSTDIAPIEATMSTTTSTTAEPATSGILIRYEEKT